jgi:hypothetical protein
MAQQLLLYGVRGEGTPRSSPRLVLPTDGSSPVRQRTGIL